MPSLKLERIIAIKYLDTSVVFDFYVKSSRSKKVQAFINQHQHDLIISTWVETEFYGVLGRRVRDGGLPNTLAERAAKRFEEHQSKGLFQVYGLDGKCMKYAAALTRRFHLGIKSADALHLALVQLENLELITSDKDLSTSAQRLQQFQI